MLKKYLLHDTIIVVLTKHPDSVVVIVGNFDHISLKGAMSETFLPLDLQTKTKCVTTHTSANVCSPPTPHSLTSSASRGLQSVNTTTPFWGTCRMFSNIYCHKKRYPNIYSIFWSNHTLHPAYPHHWIHISMLTTPTLHRGCNMHHPAHSAHPPGTEKHLHPNPLCWLQLCI